ncbi:hypothetical protein HK405_009851, partial [Cladochytrium tenue]
MHVLAAAALTALLAYYSYARSRSLTLVGSAAAALVGMATFSHPSPLFTAVLLAFFLPSSRLTRLGARRKRRIEEGYEKAARRNAVQVLSNAATGTAACALHHLLVASSSSSSSTSTASTADWACWVPPHYSLAAPAATSGTPTATWNLVLVAAYVAHYACCSGDTWASELGVLARGQPRLLTTLRRVPPGTNGAVSMVGTAASLAGGAVIGAAAAAALLLSGCPDRAAALALVAIGAASGLVGSLIDSLLGATLQRTRYNKRTKRVTPDFRRPKPDESPADLVVVAGLEVLDNHQ